MHRLNKIILFLKPIDLVVISFYLFLTILNIIYSSRIINWDSFVLANLLLVLFIFAIAYYEDKLDSKVLRQIHIWYHVPLILLTFKQLYFMIKPIRIVDYDWLFIQIDRWMFGFDPTVELFAIANPFLTELLQISYGTFYFLPIILCVVLYYKHKNKTAADFIVFSVVYGFFLSYIGYFLLPGIGPRFTLHDFAAFDAELPGLWLTPFLRELVNVGESIPTGTPNPAEVVQRDIFPSGHTMMTAIIMYLSIKMRSRSRYFFIPNGILLIFATVYLRYHYVIDLIAGIALMAFAIWSGKIIFNWWNRKTGKELFVYPSK
jgi:membrane-associated phospholipid phosphatase